jgi:hypothetical protein
MQLSWTQFLILLQVSRTEAAAITSELITKSEIFTNGIYNAIVRGNWVGGKENITANKMHMNANDKVSGIFENTLFGLDKHQADVIAGFLFQP